MHAISFPMLVVQAMPGDAVMREVARLERNYEFLSYGLTVAWVILVLYVLMMVSRQRKLKREIASMKAMLEDRGKG